jgi:hypothetical protein
MKRTSETHYIADTKCLEHRTVFVQIWDKNGDPPQVWLKCNLLEIGLTGTHNHSKVCYETTILIHRRALIEWADKLPDNECMFMVKSAHGSRGVSVDFAEVMANDYFRISSRKVAPPPLLRAA